MNSSDEDDEITAINVTPLVDVVLVLLIIFMVTARLVERRVLPLALPKAAHAGARPERSARISIWKDGSISLNEAKMGGEELLAALRTIAAEAPGVKVTLAADQEVPWERVATMLDEVKGMGVRSIAAEVEPKIR